jgi:molybdopterin molybdotransferase
VHLETCDALILSGGVSMGRFDFVPRVLNELGVRTVFHQVAQRPGKPLWFGVGPKAQAVYALPGNPVSTIVCLVRYVAAGLDLAAGRTPSPPQDVELAEDYEVKPTLALFIPAVLDGRHEDVRANLRATRGSGDFISLLGTDGFVELPKGPRVAERGSLVPFYAW